jgi:hypothetical protein
VTVISARPNLKENTPLITPQIAATARRTTHSPAKRVTAADGSRQTFISDVRTDVGSVIEILRQEMTLVASVNQVQFTP